jgi:regulator of protease activity HflC (stomatin/prohibitin superfamily)
MLRQLAELLGVQDSVARLSWTLMIAVILFGLLLAFLLWRYVLLFKIPPGWVGVVLRGGKIKHSGIKEGWKILWPVIDQGRKIYCGLQRIPIDEYTRTKDNSFVSVKGSIQYRVAEAKAEIALFRVEGHEDIIKDRVYGALRSEISKRDASDCFGHKDEVAHAVIDAVAIGIADLGFEIVDVPITEVAPDKAVIAAINEVQKAERDADAEAARAKSTKIRVAAAAEAAATAAKTRGQGYANELAEQASGYLRMIRTLTGDEKLVLAPQVAASLVMFFRSMDMKAEFAKSGKSTAVVLPDDRPLLNEVAQLLPTLVAHERVEERDNGQVGAKDGEFGMLLEELRAGLGEQREQAEALLDELKILGIDTVNERIEKLPTAVRGVARKLFERITK